MTTRYEKSLAATLAMRETCAPIFLPLFDHCVSLAKSSHQHGYFARAGRELAHARKTALHLVCACGRPAITGSALCSAHNATCWRIYDNGGNTVDRYSVCIDDGNERWVDGERTVTCLGLSEGGYAYSQFGEAVDGRHLGRRVKLESLDAATRNHIVSRLALR